MRSMLRRRLQDEGAVNFTNADLNTYLNLGLQFMQTAVMAVKPEAFIEISTANLITTGDWPELYPKPVGLLQIKKVEVDYNGDGTYSKLKKARNDQMDEFVLGNVETTMSRWSEKGRWIRIYEPPQTAVADGLRLTFVPSLTMGADTDVPDLPLVLHKGVVYEAQLEALGDTDEDMDAQTLDVLSKKLAVILDRIPLYYGQDSGEPEVFEVGIDHEDGWT
jgi:hypothetical protein